MFTLEGVVEGVSSLEFIPVGVKRIARDAPDPDLHVYRCVPDADGWISVRLFSRTDVAGSWENGWCWRCTEWARDGKKTSFTFGAGNGTYRYADLRPLGRRSR